MDTISSWISSLTLSHDGAPTYRNVVGILAERIDLVLGNLVDGQAGRDEMLLHDRTNARGVLFGLVDVDLLERHVRLCRRRHVGHDASDGEHAVVRIYKVSKATREKPKVAGRRVQRNLLGRLEDLGNLARHNGRRVRLVGILHGLDKVHFMAWSAPGHRLQELLEFRLLGKRLGRSAVVARLPRIHRLEQHDDKWHVRVVNRRQRLEFKLRHVLFQRRERLGEPQFMDRRVVLGVQDRVVLDLETEVPEKAVRVHEQKRDLLGAALVCKQHRERLVGLRRNHELERVEKVRFLGKDSSRVRMAMRARDVAVHLKQQPRDDLCARLTELVVRDEEIVGHIGLRDDVVVEDRELLHPG
jgi:hypothetical protein